MDFKTNVLILDAVHFPDSPFPLLSLLLSLFFFLFPSLSSPPLPSLLLHPLFSAFLPHPLHIPPPLSLWLLPPLSPPLSASLSLSLLPSCACRKVGQASGIGLLCAHWDYTSLKSQEAWVPVTLTSPHVPSCSKSGTCIYTFSHWRVEYTWGRGESFSRDPSVCGVRDMMSQDEDRKQTRARGAWEITDTRKGTCQYGSQVTCILRSKFM